MSSTTQTLSGSWKLAIDPNNVGRNEQWYNSVQPEAQDAPVPGEVHLTFPDHHGVSWYWHTFQLQQPTAPNHRCLLRFGAVQYLAEVWLNGVHVGSHEGGDISFHMDVTEAIKSDDENLLAVRVVHPSNTPIDGMVIGEIPSGNRRHYGGIFLPVELLHVPAVRIDDVFAQPNVETGVIDVTVKVVNDTEAAFNGVVIGSAGPAMTGEVEDSAEARIAVPKGVSTLRLNLRISQPRLWSPDEPHLYAVRVVLEARDGTGTTLRHEKSVRCGFRDFRVVDGYFHLNGKRIFLRSMHTATWFPSGGPTPEPTPALPKRDMIYAKACGFNMVRFIAGAALQEQLDLCDELGLMIYEESLAGWGLEDSPMMVRRYDNSLTEMILRDRNHPCVTIWGLLNETPDCPTYRHVKQLLPLVRSLDTTRLVLLNSGRFAHEPMVGSVSNPGSEAWECVWGAEGDDGVTLESDVSIPGYIKGAGDVHMYPKVPQSSEVNAVMRTVGQDSKPVFLSEYGIGSLLNVIREVRHYEQAGMSPDPMFAAAYRRMEQNLLADWKRFDMDGVYPFPEDMLRHSQRLHCRQRTLGFDLIRSNPKFCGVSLTSMLDSPVGGEGTWTFWRELKPGLVDVFNDGWASLRWCLFVDPSHVYSGRAFTLEAVLANEDVLAPGEYPVRLRISGQTGIVWEKTLTACIPAPAKGRNGPLAIPVFREEVTLNVPTGEYEFAASMERDAAPAGGRLKFHVTNEKQLPRIHQAVTLFGVDTRIEGWLSDHGVPCKPFSHSDTKRREVILVGDGSDIRSDAAAWRELARRMAQGSTAIFISPDSFRRASANNLGNIDVVSDNPAAAVGYSLRTFAADNVSEEDRPSFNSEFYGRFSMILSDLPGQRYRVELGMCEGWDFCNQPGMRVFDVFINDEMVLEKFDIVKETGKPMRAVFREFDVGPMNGKITIKFVNHINAASVSRVRLFDERGNMVLHLDARTHKQDGTRWLPLAEKTQFSYFDDWLYHKECVAKNHPIFDGLGPRGIMDWEYYGPVISRMVLEKPDGAANIVAAAFALGDYCSATGYASGVMIAEYAFGSGRFLLNTFNILENVGNHPAADQLILNLLQYAATLCEEPPVPLPADFDVKLKEIDYV